MEAPSWVCKKLAEIDPACRLGFGPDETGRLGFWLVKLYRVRDSERFSYAPDEWRNRGRVFNRNGKNTPDWDLIARVPCTLAEVSTKLVSSGGVIATLREWTADVRDTIRDNLLKLAAEEEQGIEDLSIKMADYAKWHNRHAYKIGEQFSHAPVAKKHLAKKADEEYKNRYLIELERLEAVWRNQGWVPREERYA